MQDDLDKDFVAGFESAAATWERRKHPEPRTGVVTMGEIDEMRGRIWMERAKIYKGFAGSLPPCLAEADKNLGLR